MTTHPHTPGPWKIDDSTKLPLAVIADTEDGEGICEGFGTGLNRKQETPESLANAHLIAAVPDIFNSLRWIVEFCNEHEEWFGKGTPNDGAEFEWLDTARQIITKAKGI